MPRFGNPTTILLSRRVLVDQGQRLQRLFGEVGADVRLLGLEGDQPLSPDELGAVDIAFLSVDLMNAGNDPKANRPLAHFLDGVRGAAQLQWLHICSAGAERPLYRELIARGVGVTTSSGANAKAVAQTAMAGALAMAREVPRWVRSQDARTWEPRRDEGAPRDFDGSRATVLGLGPIGREIAGLCKAFGLHVTGVRRKPESIPCCDRVVAFDDLNQAIERTDWLFIACPLTDQTRGLIDRSMLRKLPAGARLINVSRGPIVVEADLFDALSEGVLAGAYSDVFAVEPLPADSPLWGAPNFLLSPHSAGRSSGFPERAVQMFADNLRLWLRDQPLRHLVAAR